MLRPGGGTLQSILRTSARSRPGGAANGLPTSARAAPTRPDSQLAGAPRAAGSIAGPPLVPVLDSRMQVETYLDLVQRHPVSGFAFAPRPRGPVAAAAVPPVPPPVPPSRTPQDPDGDVDAEVTISELQLAFDQIDVNGSGQLDREEIRALVQKQAGLAHFSDAKLDAGMAQLDPNGDGAVSFAEFERYWREFDERVGDGERVLSPWQQALASGVFSSIGGRQDAICQRRNAWYTRRGVQPWDERRALSLRPEDQQVHQRLAPTGGSSDPSNSSTGRFNFDQPAQAPVGAAQQSLPKAATPHYRPLDFDSVNDALARKHTSELTSCGMEDSLN
jgi:hypothetical protein